MGSLTGKRVFLVLRWQPCDVGAVSSSVSTAWSVVGERADLDAAMELAVDDHGQRHPDDMLSVAQLDGVWVATPRDPDAASGLRYLITAAREWA